jgi:hypothetical protein
MDPATIATDRLKAMYLDTTTEHDRELRRITSAEHDALIIIIEERHRLHVAISQQRAELDARAARKK